MRERESFVSREEKRDSPTMTVSGEVYIPILKIMAIIPISIDLLSVVCRKNKVMKITIAMKMTSIRRNMTIFRCKQNEYIYI